MPENKEVKLTAADLKKIFMSSPLNEGVKYREELNFTDGFEAIVRAIYGEGEEK